MSMRVATFASTSQMLEASMRIQARMTQMELQEASGVISTDYGGLGSDSKTLIKLENAMARSEAYSSSITQASNRIETMTTTLSSVTDLISSFRTEITSYKSTDADENTLAALVSSAQSNLEELASTLNTTYEGRYLFSGSLTETAPVDLTNYSADLTTESTDYYEGDSISAAVKASSELTLSYGVEADDSAFEKAFRALSVLAQSSGDIDSDTIDEIYTLLSESLDETTALQTGLSVNASTLDRVGEQQEEYQSILEASISEIRDVDVAVLTVQLKTYESQLSASYSAIATIMSLSLQDYL